MGNSFSKTQTNKDKYNGKDIIIPLCNNWRGDVLYNVSEFLRQQSSNECMTNWVENANEIIRMFDEKVHVNSDDQKYAYIYKDINTIVKRVIKELGKLDPTYTQAKLRQTGSITSTTKVGLPHETDFILELLKDKKLNSDVQLDGLTFIELIRQIIRDKGCELTKGLNYWIIHGVQEHMTIGGVCLVLECQSNDGNSKSVGVKVDIVPVYAERETKETFHDNARELLPYSLHKYARKGELYRLINEQKCDTGLIENTILKDLTKDQKQTFRFVKFSLQNFSVLPRRSLHDFHHINEEKRLQLYGYKPLIPSYIIRLIFLHLILYVKDAEAEHTLKGGLLAACLLDMLKQVLKAVGQDSIAYMHHPLIQNRLEVARLLPYCFGFYVTLLERIMRQFETGNALEAVDSVHMLNNKCDIPFDKLEEMKSGGLRWLEIQRRDLEAQMDTMETSEPDLEEQRDRIAKLKSDLEENKDETTKLKRGLEVKTGKRKKPVKKSKHR